MHQPGSLADSRVTNHQQHAGQRQRRSKAVAWRSRGNRIRDVVLSASVPTVRVPSYLHAISAYPQTMADHIALPSPPTSFLCPDPLRRTMLHCHTTIWQLPVRACLLRKHSCWFSAEMFCSHLYPRASPFAHFVCPPPLGLVSGFRLILSLSSGPTRFLSDPSLNYLRCGLLRNASGFKRCTRF